MDPPTGSLIVRRFTDQLDGETELERATISAQERLDMQEESAADFRLQSYYEDPSDHTLYAILYKTGVVSRVANSSRRALDFSAAEIARKALHKTCTEMAKEIKPSRLEKIGTLFGRHRKSAKVQANEIMEGFIANDFDDLQLLVEGQESQWKSRHGTVSVLAFLDHLDLTGVIRSTRIFKSYAET